MFSLPRSRFFRTPWRWCLGSALTALVAGGSCTGGMEPSPSPVPTLTCPPAQTAPSPDGAGVIVNYAAPTITDGRPPFSTPTCAPASGSTFGVGTTTVDCTVRDAADRVAACSFSVTVTPPPTLDKTTFLAFGDSLTEGSLSLCFQQRPGLLGFSLRDDIAQIRAAVNVPFSYPSQLQTRLSDRYVTQTPIVVNEGRGGETADKTDYSDATGLGRLPGVLSRHQPEVLLLLEGINDIHQGTDVHDLVDSLRTMVQMARSRDIVVYLGTLLPQRLDACRNFARASTILEANEAIRSMAFLEGALLVDLHAAFVGREDTLLGPDGLHPNEAGYAAMAETFFAAIRATLER